MADRETLLWRAQEMRSTARPAEEALWDMVRARRIDGFKFRRQVPIGNYIADFACVKRRLVIEADGGAHQDPLYDKTRDAWFRNAGYLVLRFENRQVLMETHEVLRRIRETLKQGKEC